MPGSTLRAYGNTSGVPGSEPIRPIMNISNTHEWSNRSTAFESGSLELHRVSGETFHPHPQGLREFGK